MFPARFVNFSKLPPPLPQRQADAFPRRTPHGSSGASLRTPLNPDSEDEPGCEDERNVFLVEAAPAVSPYRVNTGYRRPRVRPGGPPSVSDQG